MDQARRRTLSIFAFYGALSILFCQPLFAHPTGLGIFDWDQHLFYYAEVLKNVIEYGQPPFWSPWYCGGNVLWQNPQIALLSPAYLLTLFVPLALAMKINIVLHYWVAFVGMHFLLTRVIGLSFLPGVAYLASVFTLAGGHALFPQPVHHVQAAHSVVAEDDQCGFVGLGFQLLQDSAFAIAWYGVDCSVRAISFRHQSS